MFGHHCMVTTNVYPSCPLNGQTGHLPKFVFSRVIHVVTRYPLSRPIWPSSQAQALLLVSLCMSKVCFTKRLSDMSNWIHHTRLIELRMSCFFTRLSLFLFIFYSHVYKNVSTWHNELDSTCNYHRLFRILNVQQFRKQKITSYGIISNWSSPSFWHACQPVLALPACVSS